MGCDGLQQPAGNLVGIGVKKAYPAQVFDSSQLFQQQGKPVFQAEVLAVAGGVLADEGDLPHTGAGQPLRLGDDRFKTPRAELPAQLRNDAERARMIAALGNLDVRSMAWSRQHAGCGFVVEIVG